MSLLIGISFEKYTLLAADSLHVWNRAGTKTVHEDVKKIGRTPNGLIAGVGAINIFQSVVEQLKRDGFDDPSAIPELLRLSHAELRALVPDADQRFVSDRTAVMVTYEDTVVHLRLLHIDEDYEPTDLDGSVQALLPGGAKRGENAAQQQQLINVLERAVARDDVGRILQAFAHYFAHFRRRYPDEVGPAFQVGLHAIGEIEITDLMPADD